MVKIPVNESDTVELKEKWTDDSLKALAAFANANGGSLYLGVRDDCEILGINLTNEEQQSIVSKITSLGLQPDVTWEKHDDTRILKISVEQSPIPIPFRGRYYVRVGNSTRDMAPDRIAKRLLNTLGQTWDSLPSKLKLDSLDRSSVEKFIKLARTRLPAISKTDSSEEVLSKLDLLSDEYLTNAAVLLFTNTPEKIFPGSQVHVGRFKDETHIIDDKMLNGNLWTLIEETMKALKTYLQVEFEVKSTGSSLEGLQRREKWEYPLNALREAVINAILHRDYTDPSKIQIRVYSGKIYIWSPGGLPEGVTIESLKNANRVSQLRNPILGQVLYYADLVEQWGTGIPRMIEECVQSGLPEPFFEENRAGFAVSLGNVSLDDLQSYDLNDRQLKAMKYVRETGTISNQEYRYLTGVKERTALADLKNLVDKGVLIKVGDTGRATRYEENSDK